MKDYKIFVENDGERKELKDIKDISGDLSEIKTIQGKVVSFDGFLMRRCLSDTREFEFTAELDDPYGFKFKSIFNTLVDTEED